MFYLLLGGLLLLVLVTAGRIGRPVKVRREWRFLSASAAIAAFVAAAFFAVREAWPATLLLAVLGLSLAMSARVNRRRKASSSRVTEPMGMEEARSILGVGPEATREEIQAAYTRLMRMAHPDKGGTAGLAAQLNAARERLLRL